MSKRSQYPFTGPSASVSSNSSPSRAMPQLAPNAQRRYYGQAASAPTTPIANSKRTSAGSFDSLQSSNNGGAVYSNFARPPQSTNSSESGYSSQSPYNVPGNRTSADSYIVEKYSLAPDPASWGTDLSRPEADDVLHNADKRDSRKGNRGSIFTGRGIANLGCLFVLCAGLVTLFAGFPVVSHFTSHTQSFLGGFNAGGINETGQIAAIGNWGLIDLDTPKEAHTIASYHTAGKPMQLVFSDEFNTDGRSFYPGDDPYWEAVDLHYWQTNNLEWYDPAAITTNNGALEITLTQTPSHGLEYQGGMLSTWNKFCFTGGIFGLCCRAASGHEQCPRTLASRLGDGQPRQGWLRRQSRGNVGKSFHDASFPYNIDMTSLQPYSYDTCDVGTVQNQTLNGLPAAATINGDNSVGGALSFLPGMRLSRCTCPDGSHPGPVHAGLFYFFGTFVGRSAPEIDMFEAQITDGIGGQVSQSAQWAPFNHGYLWQNTTENLIIPDPVNSTLNSYIGGAFQQATSVVSNTNQACYQLIENCFSVYGFEYQPGFDGAYISWITDNQLVWTLNQAGMVADDIVKIGPRPVPQEPLYLIANLGMSQNFGFVDFANLVFPAVMRIDYIRVYQDPDQINVGCDPKDFPTSAYINEYMEAYTNPNLTTWRDDFKQPFPKNSFLGQC
ncbi:unnamed protein product [Mycena citricolor]|uniref:GH16 domain-containing protein n=1 Tax=Mycena citricolor TaxID=2018698 RepID=A0AAD2HSE1_9AGAR|nr:unnamed protein product [Mycena citricolor]